MDTQEIQSTGSAGAPGRTSETKLGRRGRRLIVVVLLSAAVLLIEAALIYYNAVFSSPAWHTKATADTEWIDGELVVKRVLNPAVPAGGLRPKDHILGVIDATGLYHPMRGSFDQGTIARSLHYGEAFQVQVLRPDPNGKPRVTLLTYPPIPSSARLGMARPLAEMAGEFPIFVACLIAALLIGVARPEEESAFAASLLFLCFASLTWHGHMSLFPPVFRGISYFLWALLYACVTPALLWFCLRFPSPSPIDRRFPWLKRAGVEFGMMFAAWNMVLGALQAVDQSMYDQYIGAVRYYDWVLDLVFCLLALIGIASLFLNLRAAVSQDERRRLTILLCGMLGLLPWLLAYLNTVTFGIPIPLGAQIFIGFAQLLFPVSFIYAVLKHRVFGIRLIVRRGIQWAMVSRGFLLLEGLLLFALLFFGVGPAVAALVPGTGSGATAMATAVLAGGAVLATRKVNRKIMPAIDRRFFREAYDARRILTELGRAERSLARDPHLLLTTVSEQIAGALHPDQVAVFLRGSVLANLPPGGDALGGWNRSAAIKAGEAFLRVVCRGTDAERPPAASGEAEGAVLPESSLLAGQLQNATGADTRAVEVYLDDPRSWTQALLLPGADRDARAEAALLQSANVRLAVPLAIQDRLLGFLLMGEKRSEEPYSGEDKDLLLAVAQQTAVALDYAQLIEEAAEQATLKRDMQIATEVQQKLFPQDLPAVPRLDYTGFCRPARGVGGDYYDFLALEEGHLGIALGDISGKGVPAALLMASLQAMLRSQAPLRREKLHELGGAVNRLLAASTDGSKFATFFYGVYDPEGGTLTYINAGHNPPMLFRRGSSEPERLCATGTILGLFPEAAYTQATVSLRAGDFLAIFSDGITEAFDASGEEFGEERLQAVLTASGESSAREVSERVLAEIDRFAGTTPQADDITLVVARVL